MKKIIIKSFLIVSFGLTLFILAMGFYSQKLSANTDSISYITTCVGENETSIGINYHSSTAESYVQYSTTSNFTQETTLTQAATSTLWSSDKVGTDDNTGFAERYVCKVNLTNLSENTQYYYRVYAGTAISTVYKFKTASASSTNINFLFGTDIHAAGGSYTPTRANTMINNVRSNVRNLNLLVLTGDQVDRGGYEAHWESYYSGMQVYKDIMVASIPGNHEYYHSLDSAYVSPLYYNQFHNNPQNGPESKINSSYYFNYGNILFIMLDVIDKKNVTEHKEWVKNVIETNPSQWIIVGTHANAITGGSYQSDSKWMMNNFGKLFEEYQVDLVIGGHEHLYIRKDTLYNNEKNADLGVTYYVSPATQHKQYGISEDYKDDVDDYENTNYKINTISVTNSKLTLTVYNEAGEKATKYNSGELLTFDLLPKRSATVTTQKDSTLLKGLKLNYDKENEDATISWTKVYYGNVKTVKIERTANDNTTEYSTFIASEKLLSQNIGPIFNDRNYKIKVTLIKYDGSTIEQEFDITNLVPYNLNLELDGGILTSPEEWVTYMSGKVTKLPTPIKDGHVFEGWFENELFEGTAVTKIKSDVSGDKTYYAKWAKEYSITYNTLGGEINSSAQTSYLEGDSFSLQTPYRNEDMFLGWYDNPEYTGEPIDSVTGTTKGDLVLYAKWRQKFTISYNILGGELTNQEPSTYFEGYTYSLPSPTRDGYQFMGWYLNPEFTSEKIESITENTQGNLDLYAKWAQEFSIDYNTSEGTLESKINSYIEGDEFTLPIPTRSNYEFKGWYLNSEFTGDTIESITKDTKGDLNLYAKWAKISKITYDTRGGKLSEGAVTSYIEGESLTLPTPTRENDTFVGWYDNKELSGNPITEISIDAKGDMKLFAKWNSDVIAENQAATKKKCGKKNALLVINLMSSIALTYVVLKKKK
ncbi:MAG: hypothetical protein E7183_06740 [Erysipelotrichaceae bacterium]|nr:hypothetical protein [Erysipelotrichaceae bacterium]